MDVLEKYKNKLSKKNLLMFLIIIVRNVLELRKGRNSCPLHRFLEKRSKVTRPIQKKWVKCLGPFIRFQPTYPILGGSIFKCQLSSVRYISSILLLIVNICLEKSYPYLVDSHYEKVPLHRYSLKLASIHNKQVKTKPSYHT